MAASVTGAPRCLKISCPLSLGTGDTCLENLELSQCTSYQGDAAALTSTTPEEVVEAPDPQSTSEPFDESPPTGIDFRSGQALDAKEARSITAQAETRLIMLTGAQHCGKTTLLAEIYEAFRQGPINEVRFAGSKTLIGFELRCHLARADSGRSAADTSRTTKADLRTMLHLKLRSTTGLDSGNDLLLYDLSGEAFEDVLKSAEVAQEVHAFERVDQLYVLLDGTKLANTRTRHAEIRKAQRFLRRLDEEKLLTMCRLVYLLCTKWDVVVQSGASDDVLEVLHALNGQPVAESASLKLHTHTLAARPSDSSEVPRWDGISELIQFWVKQQNDPLPPIRRPTPHSTTQGWIRFGLGGGFE